MKDRVGRESDSEISIFHLDHSTVTNLQVELDASGSISLPQFLKVLYRPSPALTLALARALTPTLTLTLTRILALTLTLILTLTLTP